MSDLTLGSLFDGSGGFPLAGLISGITPVWASEIEPFPIRVTTKRLPFMKHYGDISAMDGGEIEPVDIITFGSPCQDMSVAGKRRGLDGSRSCLFYEAVRIIKEMRCKTNGKHPRYIVWENVPGAFSSNGGEDFRCVLESICRIKDEQLSVPRPQKWPYSGEIMGEGFSLAWRQFDAQFWGVPQRRKRIYLVADFNGGSAGKVLFESEGLSGYTPQGFRTWEETAGGAAESTGETGCLGVDGYNAAVDEVAATLGVNCGMSTGRNGIGDGYKETDQMYTLNATEQHGVAYSSSKAFFFTYAEEELANTLVATDYKNPPLVNDKPSGFYPQMKAEGICYSEEKSGCLVNGTNPGYQNGVLDQDYIVRRLTPTECARLQGFPDWWCSNLGAEHPSDSEVYEWYKIFETHRRITGIGAKPKTDKQIRAFLKDPHSDSAEYKMWGNGIALPNAYYVLSGIAWANSLTM